MLHSGLLEGGDVGTQVVLRSVSGHPVFRGLFGVKLSLMMDAGGLTQSLFESTQLGQHRHQPLVIALALSGIGPSCITRCFQWSDAQQLQYELATTIRRLVTECRQLLLLSKHRRPKCAVVHTQQRMDELLHLGWTVGGHLITYPKSRFDSGIAPRDGSPSSVVVIVVFEQQFSTAFVGGIGATDFTLLSTGFAVENPQDALQ